MVVRRCECGEAISPVSAGQQQVTECEKCSGSLTREEVRLPERAQTAGPPATIGRALVVGGRVVCGAGLLYFLLKVLWEMLGWASNVKTAIDVLD